MRRRFHWRHWLIGMLVTLASVATAEPIYSFGVVPQFEPGKLTSIWLPILREVESLSGIKLQMVGSPQIPEFEKSFMAGEFDFAYMNPYHALVAMETQHYEPLVRDHGRQLSGILVVHKDSPITTIAELNGKRVAFPAPNALGASLMTRADMANRFHIEVEPEYVQTHSSVYLNVALNRFVAGGGVLSTLKQQAPYIQDSLRVLYETERVAPHPVVAHPRVRRRDQQAVLKAFMTLGQSESGRELLRRIPMHEVGLASTDDYRSLKQLGLDAFYQKAN